MKREKLKTKNQIVTEMCMTWRHDYGLVKDNPNDTLSSGMTVEERKFLWSQMEQVFDNSVKPFMKYKKKKTGGRN